VIEHYFGENQGEVVGQGVYRGERSDLPLGGRAAFWEVSFAASEIEVDSGTGEVRILRHVGGGDIGRAINPALTTEQHHGAAVMGLGHTLFEELKYDDGQLLNPNVAEYRVPLCPDLPEELECILIQNHDGPGPYGAKGVGESGTIPFAPSVGNALFDAMGVRVRKLPLNPERVWQALSENTHCAVQLRERAKDVSVESSPQRSDSSEQTASDL
jgi:CO/xanthine dehydrogenase Mo-binding subunit